MNEEHNTRRGGFCKLFHDFAFFLSWAGVFNKSEQKYYLLKDFQCHSILVNRTFSLYESIIDNKQMVNQVVNLKLGLLSAEIFSDESVLPNLCIKRRLRVCY